MPVTARGSSIPICEGGGQVTFPTRNTRKVPMSPENSIVSAPSRTNIPNRALLKGFLTIASELLRPLSLQISNC